MKGSCGLSRREYQDYHCLQPWEGDRSQGKEGLATPAWSIPFACQRFTPRRILSGAGSLVENRHQVCWEGRWEAGHSWVGARAGLRVPLLMQRQKPLSFWGWSDHRDPQSEVRSIRFGVIGAAGSLGVFSSPEIETEPLSLCWEQLPMPHWPMPCFPPRLAEKSPAPPAEPWENPSVCRERKANLKEILTWPQNSQGPL